MPGPGQNWYQNTFPANMPGGNAMGAQGGGPSYATDVVSYRDPLDAKRSAAGFAPGASYPAGYLGNITDRQEDKLFNAVKEKMTSRSYQRGVHKGEKLGVGSYFWDDDMRPDMGLELQSRAVPEDVEGGIVMMTPRFAPTGNPVERMTAMESLGALPQHQQEALARKYGVDPAKNAPAMMVSPARRAQLSGSLPPWSSARA